MTGKARPRFDPETVRELAGDRSFARGEAYHRDGQVSILSLGPDRVLAQVAGTEDYRVQLSGGGGSIDGSCTCRAFEDYGFCKHMVATALAANAAGPDAGDAVGRIRAYLTELGSDALVAMVVDLAERDLALFQRLESAASIAQADDRTIERSLRKAIDQATRTGGYVEYRAVGAWAASVGAVLDTLASLASGPRAAIALPLAEHALRRLEKALEAIDDSDGHGGALLARARDIHVAAVMATRPDPVRLARDLFARETAGVYDTFFGAVEIYGEALSETGRAEYRRLATEAWSKVPARIGKQRVPVTGATPNAGVAAILDYFAERDGDIETRIALRAKDLSSSWRYLDLAEFCLQHGRQSDALRYAEEGLWIFEDDDPDWRLVSFTVDLLTKAGRKDEAVKHLWRTFERAPSLETYKRVVKSGGKGARDRALAVLEAHVDKPSRRFWGNPSDLLVEALMHEKMFEEARAAVQRHGASEPIMETLIKATEATHPREAIAFYTAKVDKLGNSGAGKSYEEAAELIARMAKLRDAAEHMAYVADLKERFRRRRNFMKLLD